MSSSSSTPSPSSRCAKRSLGVLLPPPRSSSPAAAEAEAEAAASLTHSFAHNTPADTPLASEASSLSHRGAATRSHARTQPPSHALRHDADDDDEAEAAHQRRQQEHHEAEEHEPQQHEQRHKLNPSDSDSAGTESADSAVASAESAASAASAAKAFWLRVCAWVALVVAVFSMAAVGPMFLFLEKRRISPLRAVLWRQTMQIVCLVLPTWIEYRSLSPTVRQWWKQRVSLTSDTRRDDKAKAERKARAQQEAERTAEARALVQAPLSSPRDSDRMLPTRIDVAPLHGDEHAAMADGQYDAATMHPASLQPPLSGRHSVWALLIVSISWFTSVSLWVVALPYTSAARASLFSSLYPLFIICFMRLWHHVPVSLGEFIGVLVCIVGIGASELMAAANPDGNTIAAVEAAAAHAAAAGAYNGTALAGSDATADPASLAHLGFIGDALCVLSSLFIASNVVETAPTRRVIPLFSFTLASSSMVWGMLLLSTVFFEGSSVSSPFDPVIGVFGFMASSEMFVRIALFGLVVGMVGILGFNFSVAHIHPIVFSSVQLLDPGLSGIISAVAGVEDWPVASTYLGVAIVTLGIFIVVYYQAQREEKQAAEAKAKAAAEAQGIVPADAAQLRSSASSCRPPRAAYARVVTSDADPDNEEDVMHDELELAEL